MRIPAPLARGELLRPLRAMRGPLTFLLTLYSYRTICRCDGVRKGGAMSTANQHCRNRVQRLRAGESAIPVPGSQGLDPRTLRPERLKWLRDFAKSEPAAQIAAFPVWKDHCQPFHTPHAEVLREREASKHRQVMGRFALRGPLTGAPQGEGQYISTRRAFAHHTSFYHLDGRKGQGSAGTHPPTFSLSPTVSR